MLEFSKISVLDSLIRGLQIAKRLKNPAHALLKRQFANPSDTMTITDRETGIRCLCTVESYHIFATTWYSRDYDVPGLAIRPNDVVIDIGANQGFFACYAAHKGAKVYAFEPEPENYSRLLYNVKQNALEDRIVARPWAIADHAGAADLKVSRDCGGSTSTIVSRFAENARLSVRDVIAVPCYTLSQALKLLSVDEVRLCKIDAEGAELQILSQLEVSLRMRIDAFVLEYHVGAYAMADLVSLLLSWQTHQVSLMDDKPYTGNVLRVVSNSSFRDGICSGPPLAKDGLIDVRAEHAAMHGI